jgi:hypothetical protein
MMFKELMSALEDLDSSMVWMAMHNATATQVRRRLADYMEQVLEQPKASQANIPKSGSTPWSLFVNTLKISLILCAHSSHGLSSSFSQELGRSRAHQLQDYIQETALSMYQQPWKAEAEAPRRAVSSTAGHRQQKSRH